MRCLYGSGYDERYFALASLIPPGSEVFEACAGWGELYDRCLQGKNVRYSGCDINPAFVRAARQRGIAISELDIRTAPVPPADVVILHASLYQFAPDCRAVVEKLRDAARQMLIVAEPIRNVAASTSPWLAWLASHAANIGEGGIPFRFDEAELDRFMLAVAGPGGILSECRLSGGREKLFCLTGAAVP